MPSSDVEATAAAGNGKQQAVDAGAEVEPKGNY
jgi:hypothetical protein